MSAHVAAPLRPDQLAALARLQNRRTLYEIAVLTPDGRKALVAYTMRPSQQGIGEAIRERADELVAWLGQPVATVEMEWGAVNDVPGFVLRSTLRPNLLLGLVYRTNRTKRDVIMEDSKLPYVGAGAGA